MATKMLKKTRPWCTFLSKEGALIEEINETKYVTLLTKDAELLVKYMKLGKKITNSTKK